MGDFRRLAMWQRALDAARDVYRLTAAFPATERFGLTAQMRRAAVSILSNMAEACGRAAEFRQFMRVARGSTQELAAQVLLAEALGFLAPADGRALGDALATIGRMLSACVRPPGAGPSLRSPAPPHRPASSHQPTANGPRDATSRD